jgi:uncharacterized membrane protein
LIYLATLIVMLPIDLIFLGLIAKNLFAREVGDMLGDVRMAPALMFYLLYPVGIVIFVTSAQDATWKQALLFGALFGLFCYSTFELTNMALLKHWSWTVVAVDIAWGMFVTGVSAALGLVIGTWLTEKF